MGQTRRREMGGESETPSPNEFPRRSVLIERPKATEARIQRLRMMLLRDEHEKLLRILGRSPGHQDFVAALLTDEMAGIGPLTANLLRIAAERGMDIERVVPRLQASLTNPYCKADAAEALARHFLNVKDDESLNALIFSPDTAVAKAAKEAAMKEVGGRA